MSLNRIKKRFASAVADLKEGYNFIKDGLSIELVPSLAKEALLSLPSFQKQLPSKEQAETAIVACTGCASLYIECEYLYKHGTVVIGDVTLEPKFFPMAIGARTIMSGITAGIYFNTCVAIPYMLRSLPVLTIYAIADYSEMLSNLNFSKIGNGIKNIPYSILTSIPFLFFDESAIQDESTIQDASEFYHAVYRKCSSFFNRDTSNQAQHNSGNMHNVNNESAQRYIF